MKVITIGNGFVASHLPYEIINYRLAPNEESICEFIYKYKPDVVVNCIGFCGLYNIDQCEDLKSKTYMANVILPSMLAQQCERYGVRMIHIGSGCIYSGRSPNYRYAYDSHDLYDPYTKDTGWKESDDANPKSYYSKTKYACDLIIGSLKNVTTLRIRMPISTKNNPRNFINKVKGYDKIIDIPNSVTFMDDFVRCVDWAIKEQKTGIFHVTNPDPISAVQTMIEYQKYIPDHKFSIINEEELDKITIAKRSNCILNTDKLSAAGFNMTPSKDALKECMLNYYLNKRKLNV